MINYQRIKKDCFWDLNLTSEDIENILKSNDIKKINMLFEKILLNSTSLFQDLTLFDRNQLRELIENYKLSKFNAEYAFRRKNMAEVFSLINHFW